MQRFHKPRMQRLIGKIGRILSLPIPQGAAIGAKDLKAADVPLLKQLLLLLNLPAPGNSAPYFFGRRRRIQIQSQMISVVELPQCLLAGNIEQNLYQVNDVSMRPTAEAVELPIAVIKGQAGRPVGMEGAVGFISPDHMDAIPLGHVGNIQAFLSKYKIL